MRYLLIVTGELDHYWCIDKQSRQPEYWTGLLHTARGRLSIGKPVSWLVGCSIGWYSYTLFWLPKTKYETNLSTLTPKTHNTLVLYYTVSTFELDIPPVLSHH